MTDAVRLTRPSESVQRVTRAAGAIPALTHPTGPVGPPGPPGPAGAQPVVFTQASPSGSWLFAHNLGRIPIAQVYDDAGNQIDADVEADTVHVNVLFAVPAAGSVVLI